jgi:ABC-2 type transport system permease protein
MDALANLVRAEIRKILTVNSWWGLLIPTVALALVWAWVTSGIVSVFAGAINTTPAFNGSGFQVRDVPLAGFALARSINISTVFPMLLGGLAIATETSRKTITTSFLTATNRGSLYTAKALVYAGLGLAYGLIIAGVTSGGVALGSMHHPDLLPGAGTWLAILGTGVLQTVLWTLLAVGVGALIGNTIGTVLVLLFYSILVENLVALALPGHVPAFLINHSADGMTSALAAHAFFARVPRLAVLGSQARQTAHGVVQALAGAGGTYAWWAETLIFAAWTAIFLAIGWAVVQHRDIT